MGCSCGVIAELIEVYEGFGYREDEGGWSRVVGYVFVVGGTGAGSPIWGMSAKRALWSLNSVSMAVVMADDICPASAGSRISQ